MTNYIQININITSTEERDILIANLSNLGYEFEEELAILKAYISEDNFIQTDIDNILSNKNITYSLSTILQANWNAEWEAGFQPVQVEKFCSIRAGFHPAVSGIEHDIIITPRMSFGTGHHATTYMMIQAMRQIIIKNKTVFDFGTGTGVLAILAHKLGASKVVAIDNDDWSIENATDNLKENNTGDVVLFKADSIDIKEVFDVILANINRNIILQHMRNIKQHLAPEGVIIFSGLLKNDRETILTAASKEGLNLQFSLEREDWICLIVS